MEKYNISLLRSAIAQWSIYWNKILDELPPDEIKSVCDNRRNIRMYFILVFCIGYQQCALDHKQEYNNQLKRIHSELKFLTQLK